MSSQGLIHIEKINDAHIRIDTDRAILEELSEFFTFMAPDYQWSPLYKAHRWDGKIRLLSKKNRYLPAGLTRYVKVFAKQRGYQVTGADWWKLEAIEDPVWEGMNLTAHGKSITPYDHQKEAVIAALNLKRVVLESSTSSGKSLIAYVLARYLLARGSKGLIIVPTINLVTQLYNDFLDYSSANGWDVESHVHKIHQGQSKDTKHPLVISTWQSIHDMADEDWFKRYDFVIGDEAHKFQAKSLTGIMNKLINAEHRVGMTGTVQDGNVPRLVLEGAFGPIFPVMTNKEAMDKGISAQLTIDAVICKYGQEACEHVRLMEYQEEMWWLTSNYLRNNFITNLALGQQQNCLILVNYVEKHGQVLIDELRMKASDRPVYFIHGGTEAEDREKLRKVAEKSTNAVIVASYGVFQEGVSIINLHSIIFAHPSKSKVRVLQSIGRVLRTGENKSTAKLYDIVDDLRTEDRVNYSMQHYLERFALYQRESFDVKIHQVELT